MTISREQLELAANTIRFLSVDAVNKAASGHPGMPMGMAEIGAVLWLKHLSYNPNHADWLNRDRFVLSNGHGSMFIYSLLHLAGYNVSLDDIKNFRQLGSSTPGHPESFETEGVECTTGPLGQGIANAVGMAIAQKKMAARYGAEVSNHSVYCLLGDGCLMEGISSEACSLAGHLGLGNLNVIFDDNQISIAGSTNLTFTEDVASRFEALGWSVEKIDGHNTEEIDAAISRAKKETKKPSLILARTVIGKGSPNKAGTGGVHGSPLGEDEARLAKEEMNWPADKTFYVPDEVKSVFSDRLKTLEEEYSGWLNNFSNWKKGSPQLSEELENSLAGNIPDELGKLLIDALPGDNKPVATRKISSAVIQGAASALPSMIGGSADLEPSTLTTIKDSPSVTAEDFSGRNIHFGVREHAMGAIVNGLAHYGGFIPFCSTFLCFSDYMRPSIRLAALSRLRSIFVFTHESIFLGEDGPTHQPVEHVGSLRMIPNLFVMRPADGLETAMCYLLALRRENGPAAICLTRQSVAPIERPEDFDPEEILLGAYSVFQTDPDREPELVMVATGSEVPLAVEVAKNLAGARKVSGIRVVSMPCWERFNQCSADYKNTLIPRQSKTVVMEAGASFGWSGMINADPHNSFMLSVDSFGTSAPLKDLQEKFGFTSELATNKITAWLGQLAA